MGRFLLALLVVWSALAVLVAVCMLALWLWDRALDEAERHRG
jgi:hypothetical protein